MQLSVIIVNYNVRVFLENCLLSVLKAMGGIKGEIIVVDNASDDGSVEMIKQKFPDVLLIANKDNLGFAAANNRAIQASQGKYILLLNPDTILQENTLGVMIDFFEQHREVGLAGCKILNPDGTLQLACRRSFPTPWIAFTRITGLSTIFPKSRLFGKYNLAYLNPNETYKVDAVSGSFMFVRRSIFNQVGGMDEQFFMYGEDLDWCYRIKSAGWKIFYVHTTRIIHFKGESVRRSNIDEVKVFYEAMRLFVQKHFRHGLLSDIILISSIKISEWISFIGKMFRPIRAVLIDFIMIDISLLLGELLWFGEIFHFPLYAYPVTLTIPALTIIIVMLSLGVYSKRKNSIISTIYSIILGYLILSTTTFFFKQYAFSRMVVLISGIINLTLLLSWRSIGRKVLHSPEHRKKSIFGKRTLIVGIENTGQELLRKLYSRVDDGYEVVGFIDINRKRIGEKVAGVEILGSIDNISKVIAENRVSEVIFSTDSLTYTDILSVIAKNSNRSVNYRLVPNNLEVIIGKTHIDELDDIPLVEIDYNITRPINRLLKRTFDIIIANILFLSIYPIVKIRTRLEVELSSYEKKILLLPGVIKGEFSLVGPPKNIMNLSTYLGKEGLTGLVQINYREELTVDEIEKYNLYYAKNQSLILDIEIIIKTIIMMLKKKNYYG